MGGLNLDDIQGNILRGYNSGAGSHYFVGLPDPKSGRALLRDLIPEITTARQWTSRPVIALNVALTYAGLQALGVDEQTRKKLPKAFTEPMQDRAPRVLGDDPDEWESRFGTSDIHMLVLLASSETRQEGDSFDRRFPQLADAGTWLRQRLEARGATTPVDCQEVEALLENQREHFGFADGLGQPAVEGVSNNLPGQGIPQPESGAWRDIKAGEFILGYPNEDGEPLPAQAIWLLYDGSYMVYRKLKQDVPLFRRAMAAQGQAYAEAQLGGRVDEQDAIELMAAKVAGRWRDGKALELDPGPRSGNLRLELHDHIDNNFRYGDDENGEICPAGAHVRRANPRDLLGRDGQESGRHRIIRRGMPYGPPYDGWGDAEGEAGGGEGQTGGAEGQAGEDQGIDRGLIFMCFNADLERQFEVVQGQYCDDGNVFDLGTDQDYLIGSRNEGKLTIEGKPPFFVRKDGRLVVTRGCEYLLMPGVAALERLAVPGLERVPAEEPAAAFRATALVLEQMHGNYARSRPVLRGLHPKPHACLKAKFVVADVPEDLHVGLFATVGTYDAWIRFSASHTTIRSDARADAHGMAIKVVGVRGEKLLPKERWLTTQDFVLVNHDVFFLRDALQVAEFAQAITPTSTTRFPGAETQYRLLQFFFPIDPRRWKPRTALTLVKTVTKKVDNPLGLQYWSQTPYAFGDHLAVKYSVRPVGSPPPPAPRPQDFDALEQAIETALKDADYSFDFLVQCQADPHTMPIEDPTVLWSERDSAFRKVATIHITYDDQDFADEHRRNRGENLVFTPWHTLPEHRPLGGVNRVRRAVYEASSELRHDVNAEPQGEPGELLMERFPSMMEFVRERRRRQV